MRRKFVSLLVAVLVGAMPVAHELCSAGCSGKVATTAHSHHHDGAPARGAESPEHQMADYAMDAPLVAMMGQHQGPAGVTEMARAAQCCASVLATPRCRLSGDDSTPLVSTVKRVLDPPQTAAARVIAMPGPPVGDHPASFVDAAGRPRVSLAPLTPLRI